MKATTTLVIPEDPKGLIPALRGMFTEMQGSFAEMLSKVPDAFKPQIAALKTKADQMLAGLASQPTDQVPAAQEASYAIRCLVGNLAYMNEQFMGAMKLIDDMSNRYSPVATELQGLKDLQEKGDLLPKTKVEELVTSKVEEALSAERGKVKLLGERRLELQGLNLPLPADELIAGDEKAYGEVKKTATERGKKLAGLGLELQGAELAELVYGPEVVFNATVKAAEKFGKAGGKAGTESRSGGEPLAGGTGGGGEGKRRFAV